MASPLLDMGKPKSSIVGVEKKMLIKKISETTELPALNAVIVKVSRMLRQDEVDSREVASAIERDQSLVAQILKIINSSRYALKHKIASVEHAIALLGINELKTVVYAISVMDSFGDKHKLEWEHSNTASILMERILTECGIKGAVSADLPIAMLLHDLGRLILRKYSPIKYDMVLREHAEKKVPLSVAEERILQISHADAANILLEKWEVDESISIPIKWHHTYDDLPPDTFVLETALIQFVDWVDLCAREITIEEPSKRIMTAAGIDEVDKLYWISSHRKFLHEKGGEV